MSAVAAFRRRDVNASDAIAEVLHPNMGYREKLRRRGIEPKDFERANRLQLKKKQAEQRERKEIEASTEHVEFKLTKFKSVQSRVFQPKNNSEESGDVPTKRHEFLRRGASTAALIKKKQQKQQEQQEQEAANQSGGRPATAPDSSRTTAGGSYAEKTKPTRHHVKAPIPTREELESLSEYLAKLHHKDKPDFVTSNAWEVIKQTPAKPAHDANDNDSAIHESFGRIPEYLLQRKEKWARDEEERRKNAPDPDCPPGMVQLGEDERVSTLDVLHQSLEEAQHQASRLPLRIETPSQIRRKNELEARLQEIEDAIKVFSKPKVYVAKLVSAAHGSPQQQKKQPLAVPTTGRRMVRRRSSQADVIAA